MSNGRGRSVRSAMAMLRNRSPGETYHGRRDRNGIAAGGRRARRGLRVARRRGGRAAPGGRREGDGGRGARSLGGAAAGRGGGSSTPPPPLLYLFEPHHPEQCGFAPNAFVDVTPAMDRKEAAMAAMTSQSYLRDHYRQRSEQRAVQA